MPKKLLLSLFAVILTAPMLYSASVVFDLAIVSGKISQLSWWPINSTLANSVSSEARKSNNSWFESVKNVLKEAFLVTKFFLKWFFEAIRGFVQKMINVFKGWSSGMANILNAGWSENQQKFKEGINKNTKLLWQKFKNIFHTEEKIKPKPKKNILF